MEELPQMKLLGDGPLHQRLSKELGLALAQRPDPNDSTPLVVVAERAPDVQAISQARSWAPIRAVIAWKLPESALLRLLELDLPVFIGLPEHDEIARAVVDGVDITERAAERQRTARLAAVEAALSAPGRADEAAEMIPVSAA
ncbi:MAG: hypothetical protein QOD72_2724 [Acidimicrobiaceae bacterium]|nr:hypothetical protein [Acidimicrobiaceae bacterium]